MHLWSWSRDSSSALAETVQNAKPAMQKRGLRKIKVLPFEPVGNGTDGAGRYIADLLTQGFANTSRTFAISEPSAVPLGEGFPVTPRAEMNSTNSSARDGLVVGTVYFGTNSLLLFTRILELKRDDVIYSAETELQINSELRSLLGKEVQSKVTAIREVDGLKFHFKSLRIANGRDYILSVDLVNTEGSKRWVAIDPSKSLIRDTELFEFEARGGKTVGVLERGSITGRRKGSEVSLERPLPIVIYFDSSSREASLGPCELQLVAEVGTTPDGEFEERSFIIGILAVRP